MHPSSHFYQPFCWHGIEGKIKRLLSLSEYDAKTVSCVFSRSAAEAGVYRVKADFSFAEPWTGLALIFRGKADIKSTPTERGGKKKKTPLEFKLMWASAIIALKTVQREPIQKYFFIFFILTPFCFIPLISRMSLLKKVDPQLLQSTFLKYFSVR